MQQRVRDRDETGRRASPRQSGKERERECKYAVCKAGQGRSMRINADRWTLVGSHDRTIEGAQDRCINFPFDWIRFKTICRVVSWQCCAIFTHGCFSGQFMTVYDDGPIASPVYDKFIKNHFRGKCRQTDADSQIWLSMYVSCNDGTVAIAIAGWTLD